MKVILVLLAVVATLGFAHVASAQEVERPELRVLGLDEASVLERFVPDVRRSSKVRRQALDLWRRTFAAEADVIRRRYLAEADWRPAFADAAALVERYLEASNLPRRGEWPIEGRGGSVVDGRILGRCVKVETLVTDGSGGRRTSEIRCDDRPRPVLLAPEADDEAPPGDARMRPAPAARTKPASRR